MMHADVEEVLLTGEEVQARVAELGAQLAADYEGREPVLVSVLKGSIIFPGGPRPGNADPAFDRPDGGEQLAAPPPSRAARSAS